jgi:GNAT superfamily N-acetyltransferase
VIQPEPLIRPVQSLDECELFDLVGAQLPTRLTRVDRRFAELAEHFPEDKPLMLVATIGGKAVGGALAFRRNAEGVTLRVVGVSEDYRSQGIGHRLLKAVEDAAAVLGVRTMSLGADEARGFYGPLGYSQIGGEWQKALRRRTPRQH